MNRRDFLKYSLGLASQAALIPLSARADSTPDSTPIWEGIYTGRFTHRSGVDPLEIHASLLDVTAIDITLKHLDAPAEDAIVGVYTVEVDDTQVPEYPEVPTGGAGMYGPQFPVRLSIDTLNLEPGYYQVSIDPLALRPENRENLSGIGFVSLNSVSRFVMTAAVPGSISNILWLHDSLTGTAYGGFGGESIYGGSGTAGIPTVSFLRPGLDRETAQYQAVVRYLKSEGYQFEFMDAIEFALQPASFVNNYDLIVVCNQFEYLPHSFLGNLQAHVDTGGSLLLCSNEFACFRTRIDADAGTMTTYEWDAETQDPVSGFERAGIGMHNPETIWETELAGLCVWGAGNIGGGPKQDMTITNVNDTGWLLEGTGFDDVIPSIIRTFNAGNRGALSAGNQFDLLDIGQSRTPSDTVVWAVTPSPDARKWWEGLPGQKRTQWPVDPDGYAMCTWRETGNGGKVIGMSGHAPLQNYFALPGYDQLFENIFSYLLRPPSAVPALAPLGLGVLSAALAETGRRFIAGKG